MKHLVKLKKQHCNTATIFFKTIAGRRQGGVATPILFNIYLDFLLRCVEHEVLLKFPNNGLQYSYLMPGRCPTREHRSVHGLTGI